MQPTRLSPVQEMSSKIIRDQDVGTGSIAAPCVDLVRNLMDTLKYGIECLQEFRFGATHPWTEPFEGIFSHEE